MADSNNADAGGAFTRAFRKWTGMPPATFRALRTSAGRR